MGRESSPPFTVATEVIVRSGDTAVVEQAKLSPAAPPQFAGATPRVFTAKLAPRAAPNSVATIEGGRRSPPNSTMNESRMPFAFASLVLIRSTAGAAAGVT